MYNMDEKDVMLRVIARPKRVFNKQLYQEGKIGQVLEDRNRDLTTILACICADGPALQPSSYISQTPATYRTPSLNPLDVSDNVAVAASQSGWTNNDIGLA
jgi:hypothetical protein